MKIGVAWEGQILLPPDLRRGGGENVCLGHRLKELCVGLGRVWVLTWVPSLVFSSVFLCNQFQWLSVAREDIKKSGHAIFFFLSRERMQLPILPLRSGARGWTPMPCFLPHQIQRPLSPLPL